ncbi:DUF3231 family protein [Metabacillus sp. GX 13764]|uniref:DUF3231 family protein n=1 Tax=Metabacillus kandeliae TaxID=2900151 RepID=UPI001E64FC40|nr:DUF3231 family protein [Metabacillus kandeliae]MCD7034763.1 DUF3231 family protein [Metabacillus kandeliae]
MAQINLSSPEISALWSTYIQESASQCFLKHFLTSMEDEQIDPILKEALQLSEDIMERIKQLFQEEAFPVPDGFSDRDVNPDAPPLFTDLFALSYVYRMSQLSIHSYASSLTVVARTDLLTFFVEQQSNQVILYEKSVKLMLEKGIYDRPPKIPYPDKVKYAEQKSYLGHYFGEKRPLNTIELSEMFFTIEKNYIGMIFLEGLIQAANDDDVRHYLLKGKHLAQMQIDVFNKVLKEEGHFGTIPVSKETTASVVMPFSSKLVLFSVAAASGSALALIGSAISFGLRKDIAAHYLFVAKDIISFCEEGAKLMIKRGWYEQPPQAPNRRE